MQIAGFHTGRGENLGIPPPKAEFSPPKHLGNNINNVVITIYLMTLVPVRIILQVLKCFNFGTQVLGRQLASKPHQIQSQDSYNIFLKNFPRGGGGGRRV